MESLAKSSTVSSLPGSRVFGGTQLLIARWLLFASTKCKELSDVDGNIIQSIQSRIVKALLNVFKITSWDL